MQSLVVIKHSDILIAKCPALLHGGFGNAAIGNVLV